jgi:hypothetical protein
MFTEKRGAQLRRIQEHLQHANIVFSIPSALVLGIWGIYIFSHWHHVENVPGCNSKIIVDFALAVSIIDIYSMASGLFGIAFKQHAEKNTSEKTKTQYAIFKRGIFKFYSHHKVDSVIRFVINIILKLMKNIMLYLLWISECKTNSVEFYASLHYFMIAIVIRVLVSSTMLTNSYISGKLSEYVLRKYKNEGTSDHAELGNTTHAETKPLDGQGKTTSDLLTIKARHRTRQQF